MYKKFYSIFYSFLNKIYHILARLKTIFWYNLFLGDIGKKTTFYTPLRLIHPENVYLGQRVHIFKQSRIETITEWYDAKFNPSIEIGDSTSIEQRLHMTCANRISIGSNVVISADAYISDHSHDYNLTNKNVMLQPLAISPVIIGDYCFIGIDSKIFRGTKLGNGCVVGANSVVSCEFPAYCVLVGTPAKIIKRYDEAKGEWRKTNESGEFI